MFLELCQEWEDSHMQYNDKYGWLKYLYFFFYVR